VRALAVAEEALAEMRKNDEAKRVAAGAGTPDDDGERATPKLPSDRGWTTRTALKKHRPESAVSGWPYLFHPFCLVSEDGESRFRRIVALPTFE
jgi:hypothetical protein